MILVTVYTTTMKIILACSAIDTLTVSAYQKDRVTLTSGISLLIEAGESEILSRKCLDMEIEAKNEDIQNDIKYRDRLISQQQKVRED